MSQAGRGDKKGPKSKKGPEKKDEILKSAHPMTVATWDPEAQSVLIDTGSSYILSGYKPSRLKYEPACCMNEGAKKVSKAAGSAPCYKGVNDRNLAMFKAQGASTVFEPYDDAPMQCGSGKIDMQVSKNMAVYLDYDTCMEFSRSIKNNHRVCAAETIPFHVYWSGPMHYQLLQAARSFLATQDLTQSVMWIWSTQPEPTDDSRWSELQAVAGEYLKWKNYDLAFEIKDTILEGREEHVGMTDSKNWVDSDLFRVLITHNYGGVYMDADVVLLRDFAPLLGGEWLYAWGSSCNFANGAIASLHKESDLAKKFLTKIGEIQARPGSFDWGRNMYHSVWQEEKFDVMPVCMFDVHWMYNTNAAHAPYPGSYSGPFAVHLHSLVWSDCVAQDEPLDLISTWYTQRIREKLGHVDDFGLPRENTEEVECKAPNPAHWGG
jgi:hypothetical protein